MWIVTESKTSEHLQHFDQKPRYPTCSTVGQEPSLAISCHLIWASRVAAPRFVGQGINGSSMEPALWSPLRQERRRLTRWHSGIYSSERRSEPSEPSDAGRPEILRGSLQDVSTSRFSENLPIWWILSNHVAPVSTASPDPKLGSSSQHGVLKPMEILCPSVSYTLHLTCFGVVLWREHFFEKMVTWGPLRPNKKKHWAFLDPTKLEMESGDGDGVMSINDFVE